MKEKHFKEFTVDSVLNKFGGPERFTTYVEFLLDENSRMNLVSRETTPEDLYQLIADCLIPAYMEGPQALFSGRNWTRMLDIGSGGGLPAIPLAIALGNVELTLIERTGKKAMFLRRALRKFGIRGRVLNCNFREFSDNPAILTPTGEMPPITESHNSKPSFDIISIRWVKADSAMIRKASMFLVNHPKQSPKQSGLIYFSDATASQEIKSNTLLLNTYSYHLTRTAVTTNGADEPTGSDNAAPLDDQLKDRTLSVFQLER